MMNSGTVNNESSLIQPAKFSLLSFSISGDVTSQTFSLRGSNSSQYNIFLRKSAKI